MDDVETALKKTYISSGAVDGFVSSRKWRKRKRNAEFILVPFLSGALILGALCIRGCPGTVSFRDPWGLLRFRRKAREAISPRSQSRSPDVQDTQSATLVSNLLQQRIAKDLPAAPCRVMAVAIADLKPFV